MSAPAYTEVQVLSPEGWHELVAEALALVEVEGADVVELGVDERVVGWSDRGDR